MTPDWQPWPPPADGELIELEVDPDDPARYITAVAMVHGRPDFAHFVMVWCRVHGEGAVVRDHLSYDSIPPTARWRRV